MLHNVTPFSHSSDEPHVEMWKLACVEKEKLIKTYIRALRSACTRNFPVCVPIGAADHSKVAGRRTHPDILWMYEREKQIIELCVHLYIWQLV